jgi:hypothetical protein
MSIETNFPKIDLSNEDKFLLKKLFKTYEISFGNNLIIFKTLFGVPNKLKKDELLYVNEIFGENSKVVAKSLSGKQIVSFTYPETEELKSKILALKEEIIPKKPDPNIKIIKDADSTNKFFTKEYHFLRAKFITLEEENGMNTYHIKGCTEETVKKIRALFKESNIKKEDTKYILAKERKTTTVIISGGEIDAYYESSHPLTRKYSPNKPEGKF